MRKILLVVVGAVGGGGMLLALVINCAACRISVQPYVTGNNEMFFPFAVPGTSLVAENLVSYDGAFIEDKSDREVVEATALMLRNIGKIAIRQAAVEIIQGDRKLVFEATQIPPEATVLVLEKDGKRYSEIRPSSCSGWALENPSGWDTDQYIRMQDAGMGCVDITNITDSALEDICLYYKTEYADGLFFLGGITYSIEIKFLSPGQTIRISPDHYANGSSRIMRIEFEE